LPQGPLWRKRAGGAGKYQNGVKSVLLAESTRNSAISGLASVPDGAGFAEAAVSVAVPCGRRGHDCTANDPHLLPSYSGVTDAVSTTALQADR
jgi:hypothetical protein